MKTARLRFNTEAGRSLRRAIFLRDEFTCQNCGWQPDMGRSDRDSYDGSYAPACFTSTPYRCLMVDHIIPRSTGGALSDLGNLQTLCNSCNSAKCDRVASP